MKRNELYAVLAVFSTLAATGSTAAGAVAALIAGVLVGEGRRPPAP